MNDSQSIVQILIKFGLLDAQNADTALQKLQLLDDAQKDLATEMGVVNVTQDDVMNAFQKATDTVAAEGDELNKTGGHASNARLKHMALHHAIAELNKVVPGLGTTLTMLQRGMQGVGESADGLSGKMSALLTSVGPLIVAMLAIQAVTVYWDLYKEKLKEVAAEQEATSKSVDDSLRKMVRSLKALDDATHPKKKNEAQKDEKLLEDEKQRIEDAAKEKGAYDKKSETDQLKAIADQRKENKKAEKAELGIATSPEERAATTEKFSAIDDQLQSKSEAIKKAFEDKAKALEDWKLGELARASNEMTAFMQQQTEKLKSDATKEASGPEERAAFRAEQGIDKFSEDTKAAIKNAKRSQILSAIGTLGASSLMIPDAAAELEKSLHDHREAGRKKREDINGKVAEKEATASELAASREGVSTGADKATHDAGQSSKLHRIESGAPSPEVISARNALNAGWAQAQSLMKESHEGNHRNLGVILQHLADQKALNREMAARLQYLEAHHGT
jgi:hypothetical protein